MQQTQTGGIETKRAKTSLRHTLGVEVSTLAPSSEECEKRRYKKKVPMSKNKPKNKPDVLFHIRIPVTVLGVILLLGLTLIVLYRFLPHSHSGIVFVGAVVAASATIYGAFFTAYNVRKGIEALEQSNRDKHVSIAFTFIERWNSPGFLEIKKSAWHVIKDTTQEAMANNLKNDENKRAALIVALNFFEELAISIRFKGADEDVSKSFFRFVALELFNSSSKWITQYRQEKNAPRVFLEYEDLYNRWK